MKNVKQIDALLEKARSQIFMQMLISVWTILFVYSVLYAVLQIPLSFIATFSGVTLFCPLALWLERSGKLNQARILFVASCNAYIFFTSLGTGHSVSAEYYFLPATIVPFLLFENNRKVEIAFSVSQPIVGWIAINFFPHFAPPTEVSFLPFTAIQSVNFVGAFLISVIFLSKFFKINAHLRAMLIDQLLELQSTRAQLVQAQSVAKIGSWSYKAADNVISWTDQMFDLFPESKEIGAPTFERHRSTIHPEDVGFWESTVQTCLQTGENYKMRFRSVFPDKILWIEAYGQATRDERGVITGLYGTCQDISDLMNAKIEAERAESLLKNVFDCLPIMVFVKDFANNLRFKYFSRAGQRLVGLNEEQIIGKNDHDLFPKEQADFFRQNDEKVFSQRVTLKIPKEPLESPLGQRWLETIKVPTYKADGAPDLLIGVSRDITEELQLVQKLEVQRSHSWHNAKLASLGEMAAGIAHEINNPLAVIVGNVSLLKKFKDDPQKFDAKSEVILKAAFRIEKIVKGLQKFSRSSDGQEHRRIDISEILIDVMTMTEGKVKQSRASTSLEVEPELCIFCDPVEIEQVLVNLINNALDAVKNLQDRWVAIKIFKQDKNVVVQVIDSGNGIPPEKEEKLFQPFFTTKSVGEGTGLGLSISRGILEQHHATIRLNKSIANTCFEIVFEERSESKGAKRAA